MDVMKVSQNGMKCPVCSGVVGVQQVSGVQGKVWVAFIQGSVRVKYTVRILNKDDIKTKWKGTFRVVFSVGFISFDPKDLTKLFHHPRKLFFLLPKEVLPTLYHNDFIFVLNTYTMFQPSSL